MALNKKSGVLTKKARIDMIRARIDANAMGIPWSEIDVDFFNLVCGTVFAGIKRMRNPSYPSDPRHIHVHNGNLEWHEFSWNKAINGEGLRPVHKVLRDAVADDLRAYRADNAQNGCEKCAAVVDLTTDHVDPPFFEIAEQFIAAEPEINLVRGASGSGWIMESVEQEARWIAFHASLATYQVLCRSCNSAKGRKKPVAP